MEETSGNKIAEEEAKNDAPIIANVNAIKPIEPVENVGVLSKESNYSNETVEKVISLEKIKTVFDKKPSEDAEVPERDQPAETEKNTKQTEKDTKQGSILENSSKESQGDDVAAPLRQTTKHEIDKRRVGSATSGFISEKINRNQSDIFSLKDETTIASSIFSVNGSPSRKVYRKVQKIPSGNIFPFGQVAEPPSEQVTLRDKMRDKNSYHETKRPSSSLRNPLTGTGLNSNDEYKFKGAKRMDGNPLLGLGYSPEATPSTHRIPPGGYSHKLW